MIEICHLTAGNIAELEVWNEATISTAITQVDTVQSTRIIVTDVFGKAIYDSLETGNLAGRYTLFPEIVKALEGNDVFRWRYSDNIMLSKAASPIYTYGTLVGCVYIMECNPEQGALIASIQSNILIITVLLEIVLIIFSVFFSRGYSKRFKKIMNSIRTARDGDYSHKVQIAGSDELNMLSDEFNALIHRLQISENKRNQFVSDASHELKTPLASIKLLSDSILQNSMDTETVKEFVGDIGNEAERLNRMSQKLLSLSRIENQQAENSEIIYIAPTIEKVIRMLTAAAQERHIQITTDLQADVPILMAQDDLYQVIFNLIENGIKYNKPGGSLTIILQREKENAVIQIQDTGMGIPADSLEHIFERFYRVDKARSRSTGGSGLGLSIVRNIVKRNLGTIHVESVLDSGTTFVLSFPAVDIEEEEL